MAKQNSTTNDVTATNNAVLLGLRCQCAVHITKNAVHFLKKNLACRQAREINKLKLSCFLNGKKEERTPSEKKSAQQKKVAGCVYF
jgi:hypothetical protein